MCIDVIICTDHVLDTLNDVARVAACAPAIDQVVIVDSRSQDVGVEHIPDGPRRRVISAEPGYRRGDYELIGIDACDADIVVFLDADLVGLTQRHLEMLTWAVREGDCGMACGLYDRGPVANQVFARMLPIVDTQRAVRTDLLAATRRADIADFGVEPALNGLCAGLGIPTHSVVLPGLQYRVDPAHGRPELGLWREHVALGQRFFSYASYLLTRRQPNATHDEHKGSTSEAA